MPSNKTFSVTHDHDNGLIGDWRWWGLAGSSTTLGSTLCITEKKGAELFKLLVVVNGEQYPY